jgi:hypothetical protein
VRRLVDVGLVPQTMALVRPMCVLLAAGAVLYLGAPWVLAAATLPALLARAVPLGGAYLLAYLFFAWLAWRLAGRPAGLERHALDRLARRLQPRRPGAP